MYAEKRLVIVSNRVPKPDISETVNETSTQSVSGLVNGLHPALRNREGLWFGWSGKAVPCHNTLANLPLIIFLIYFHTGC